MFDAGAINSTPWEYHPLVEVYKRLRLRYPVIEGLRYEEELIQLCNGGRESEDILGWDILPLFFFFTFVTCIPCNFASKKSQTLVRAKKLAWFSLKLNMISLFSLMWFIPFLAGSRAP